MVQFIPGIQSSSRPSSLPFPRGHVYCCPPLIPKISPKNHLQPSGFLALVRDSVFMSFPRSEPEEQNGPTNALCPEG